MREIQHYIKGFRYPRRAAIELYGLYRNYLYGGNSGQYITNQDWDNLIILDACRYDLFEDVAAPQLSGTLDKFKSRGTHTGEFMKQNFTDVDHNDTVYISSNPNPAEVDARFFDVISVWDDGWDADLHTVPPEEMTEATITASKDYPNKRIITHYLQPHYPFIGQIGKQFHDKHGYTDLSKPDHIWLKMRRGDISKEEVWNAYEENLEVVLPHVSKLLKELIGKTVVTSDHGNAFGEYGVYGHPPRAYIPCLENVPWFEAKYEKRKKITKSDASVTTQDDSADIEGRLADLGYFD